MGEAAWRGLGHQGSVVRSRKSEVRSCFQRRDQARSSITTHACVCSCKDGSVKIGSIPQPKGSVMSAMHEVDYRVYGSEMQYVEVELDPMEAVVAEAGGMMYMDDGIEMETIFGDGSQQSSGFLGALMGAGRRLLVGESLF